MQESDRQKAVECFNAGQYEEAARRFASLLLSEGQGPSKAELWNDWASSHAAAGHFHEAMEGFRRAQRSDPTDQAVSANLRALAAALEARSESRKRKADSANGGEGGLKNLHDRAVACFRRGQMEQSREIMRESLYLEETSRVWNDLGTVQVAIGDMLEADISYRKAAELDPNNLLAITNLILLRESIGWHEQAATWKARVPASVLEEARAAAISAMNRGASAQSFQSPTIGAFLKAVSELPEQDPGLSAEMAAALAVGRSNSSYFARQCCDLLKKLPEAFRFEACAALEASGRSDYRLHLALAAYHLDHGHREAVFPLIQEAFDRNPNDLYADRLFDYCIQQRSGNERATDEYLARSFCGKPWEHFEISTTGDVYQCCPGWLPVPAGKMGQHTAAEIWNSEVAQEIRKSVLDGSFRYCSRTHCPSIAGRTLPAKSLAPSPSETLAKNLAKTQAKTLVQIGQRPPLSAVAESPSELTLTYDRTCNLACPQCRSDFIFASSAEQREMSAYVPEILEMAKKAEVVYLNGAGELFGSRHTRQLLRRLTRAEFPQIGFSIITNGLLFDRRAYDQFDLRGRIRLVEISIDAATAETYAVVRRPGDFNRLLDNMRFLDDLRIREGEAFRMDLRFVVSALNYREMPGFVQLARRFHADAVRFTRFRNLGHSEAEFKSMNIYDPAHPEHREFLRVLQSPELLDPMVDLGSAQLPLPRQGIATAAAQQAAAR